MHRSRFPFAAAGLCLALTALFGACDSDVSCPDGFKKDGKLCLEETDGEPSVTGDSGSRSSESDRETDSSTSSTSSTTSTDASAQDAATGTQTELDASSGTDAGSASDAGSGMDTSTQSQDAATSADSAVAPECDSTHACAAGYACTSNKCVSMCEQTRCDANATCGLTRGAPVCTCKSGYLPMGGSSTRPTCVRDLACTELNCNENASCELGSDQLRHCVCKDGYNGDGRNCTAISCPSLNTLRTDHRRPSTSDGTTTVGKVATFTCDPGYKLSGGPLVCDEEGHWSGTPAVCSAITCAKPTQTVSNGTLTTPDQASYQINAKATYKCNDGFKPARDATINCNMDGTWTTPMLTCTEACGDGSWDRTNGFTEECDPKAQGSSAWTCTDQCKACTGVLCPLSCNGPSTNDCPTAPESQPLLGRSCPTSTNKCVLTCTNARNSCPTGTICMAGATTGSPWTCVSAPDAD